MAHRRLTALDGWRGWSILLVLAAHMLPLGPKTWHLNHAAGLAGMAIFFTLSGFLITSTLLKHPSVPQFLIRRFCRIEPLALVATVLYLALQSLPFRYYPPHLLYYVNYQDSASAKYVSVIWSLCVEVHFYGFVAVLVLLLGRRGLFLLPILAAGITALRIHQGVHDSIRTHLRGDEILAGSILALIWIDHERGIRASVAKIIGGVPTWIWALIYAVGCSTAGGPLAYLRPYLAMAMVGSSLFSAAQEHPILGSRPLRYIAEISFALYMLHEFTLMGWLGSGETLERYLKRPFCILLTFALAHVSTFHFEHHWMAWGKRLARHLDKEQEARGEQVKAVA